MCNAALVSVFKARFGCRETTRLRKCFRDRGFSFCLRKDVCLLCSTLGVEAGKQEVIEGTLHLLTSRLQG